MEVSFENSQHFPSKLVYLFNPAVSKLQTAAAGKIFPGVKTNPGGVLGVFLGFPQPNRVFVASCQGLKQYRLEIVDSKQYRLEISDSKQYRLEIGETILIVSMTRSNHQKRVS